ncbi:amino acid adenylation domain-containing protein [Lysobacter pythonis]|uniref:Amino acid adenylation domain-containing protein n=1 Tax=Solilutibacter pythonis TaxID=2483112 RepID=A0A3M2HWY9_9GAMM|nr:non-ribosomal peptide synthetase [Lysobacter pythonis]RMH93588.1 amino acid adenylation domain-containing protein [Lysobacter pythonis]
MTDTATQADDDALAFSKLRESLDAFGVRLSLERNRLKFSAPRGVLDETLRDAIARFRERLIISLRHAALPPPPPIQRDPAQALQPFPMTPIQQAYYVGECGGLKQSTLPCFYHEYRLHDIQAARLQEAIRALRRDFPILRTRFLDDGRQCIAPDTGKRYLGEEDWRALDASEKAVRHAALKASHLSDLPALSAGEPFRFTRVRLTDDDTRLFMTIRLNIVDGPSLAMLLRGLVERCQPSPPEPPAKTLDYRDYVLAAQALREGPHGSVCDAYWSLTLPKLPASPALPQTGISHRRTQFQRHTRHWPPERWQRLRDAARHRGVTANAVLVAVYAAVLRRWSAEPAFTLNVLANFRPFNEPALARMAGNCSNTVPLDCHPASNFLAQARRLQSTLTERLEHAATPGVELMRRLQRQRGPSDNPVLPFVFTSGLQASMPPPPPDMWRFELIDSHLQTPQVWLDHQAIEHHQGLTCHWDAAAEIFAPGVVEALATESARAIDALIDQPATWMQYLPGHDEQATLPALTPGPRVPNDARLSDGFLMQARHHPERSALVRNGRTLSYGELLRQARRTAASLRRHGVTPESRVAINLPRGFEQIIAILGVSLCGAAYLPLSSHWPRARIAQILADSETRFEIALGGNDAHGALDIAELLAGDHDAADPPIPWDGNSPAYVIYTSGSTGAPKGVMISHRSALNTIEDINHRFGIHAGDRVLALSAPSFDLSVQDIFGTLAAGATLVLPADEERPDPRALAELCQRERISVWNSVPAMLEMLTLVTPHPAQALSSLRLIMLSGDWMPLPLARLLRTHCQHARLIVLGGATEASIWSNYYEVIEIADHWRSIPYGFALSRQRLHVLDARGQCCAPGVAGEIHIAGDGLALGYLNDPERTAAQFIRHASGERLYRTGDIGRYLADGAVEFLGRRDLQVKVNGFRIELSEIETQLERIDGVQRAVALTRRTALGGVTLVCLYTGDGEEGDPATFESRALAQLAARLPAYMVPARLLRRARLPLSANGKIDRRAAEDDANTDPALTAEQETAMEAPTHIHQPLARIWQALLGKTPQPDNDFFQHGGDSLLAVRLVAEIERRFGLALPLQTVFQRRRFAELATYLARQPPPAPPPPAHGDISP